MRTPLTPTNLRGSSQGAHRAGGAPASATAMAREAPPKKRIRHHLQQQQQQQRPAVCHSSRSSRLIYWREQARRAAPAVAAAENAQRSSSSSRSAGSTRNGSSSTSSVERSGSPFESASRPMRRGRSSSSSISSSSGSSTSTSSSSDGSALPRCVLCRGTGVFRHGPRLERREALLQRHGLGASCVAAAAASSACIALERQSHSGGSSSSSSSSEQQQHHQQQQGPGQRREFEALRRCLLSGLQRKERQRYRCPFCCWAEAGAAAAATAAAAAAERSSRRCVARRGLEAQALLVQQQLQQQQLIDVDCLSPEQQQPVFVKAEGSSPTCRTKAVNSSSSSGSSSGCGSDAVVVECEGFEARLFSSEARHVVSELVKAGCFISVALQAVAAVQRQQQPQQQQEARRDREEAAAAAASFAEACAAAAGDIEAEAVSQQLLDLVSLRAREQTESARDRERELQQQQLSKDAQPLWMQHGLLCSFLQAANPQLFDCLTQSSSSSSGGAASQDRLLLQRLFGVQQLLLRSYTTAGPHTIYQADREAWLLLRGLGEGEPNSSSLPLNIHDCLLVAAAAAAGAAANDPAAAAAASLRRRTRTRGMPVLLLQSLPASSAAPGSPGVVSSSHWPLTERQRHALQQLQRLAAACSFRELQASLARAFLIEAEKAVSESLFFPHLDSLAAPSVLLRERQCLLQLLGWWLRLAAFASSVAAELQLQLRQQRQQPVVQLTELLLRPHPTLGASHIQLLLLQPLDSAAAAVVVAAATEAGATLHTATHHEQQQQQQQQQQGQEASPPSSAAACRPSGTRGARSRSRSVNLEVLVVSSSGSSSSSDEAQEEEAEGPPAAPRQRLRAGRAGASQLSGVRTVSRQGLSSSSSNSASSKLHAFACCGSEVTAEGVAKRLGAGEVSGSRCCSWDVELPSLAGLKGLEAACIAFLPWRQQQQQQGQQQQQQGLCAYEALSRLWRLTVDPQAAHWVSPRVSQLLEQQLQQKEKGGGLLGLEDAPAVTRGFHPLVAAGLWLPCEAFVGQQQQQQRQEEEQRGCRERMRWGRLHLLQLASLLLPQPSLPLAAHSSSSNSSSEEGIEGVWGHRWLRGALRAVRAASEREYLLEEAEMGSPDAEELYLL
ncbi:hypothetical protein Esti_001111 [Eimeria stiedai]